MAEAKEVQEITADVHETETPPKRDRTLTEKGRAYMIKTKMSRLEHLCRSLEKQLVLIHDLIDMDTDDNGEVLKQYSRWMLLYEQFLEESDNYKEHLANDQEQREFEDDWFLPRDDSMKNYKGNIDKWLNQKARNRLEDLDDKRSTRSDSSKSSKHTIISAKLKEEEKRVELKIRAERLESKHRLEEEKLKLKLREEKMDLEDDIAISDAKSKVIQDMEDNQSVIESNGSVIHSVTKHTDTDVIMLAQHLNKPKIELQKFSGDYLQYHRFMRQFRAKVIANCNDPEERLNYLEQYTSGEPQRIVVGFSYLDATKGYEAAIRELDDRYGDQESIVQAFISKALSWSTIKADNPKELDKFAVFLTECDNAIKCVDAMKVLEYSDNMKQIVAKLPYHMHDRWRNLVYQTKERGNRVTFSDLVKYVRMEAKKASDPVFGRDAMSKTQDMKSSYSKQKTRSHANTAEIDKPRTDDHTKQNAFKSPCLHCDGSHSLESCNSLRSKSFYERTEILKHKGCCFGCLRIGHQRKDCRNKATCTYCNGRHPSVLHVEGRIPPRFQVQGQSETNVKTSAHIDIPKVGTHAGAGDPEVTMAIVPVKVCLRGSCRLIDTYAFMDPGSNVSFCSDQLRRQLGCEGKRRRLTMDTMGVQHTLDTYEVQNIELFNMNLKHRVYIPKLYSKERIPVTKRHIPTLNDIRDYPHLKDVHLPQLDAHIGLLLGNNVPDAYSPIDVRVGPSGTPHASLTRLGWIVWNVIRPNGSNVTFSHRVDVQAIEKLEESRDLETLYRKSLSIDFQENSSDEQLEHSVEDKRFLSMMSESAKFINGHYEVCLPFRTPPYLPDNKRVAIQRLQGLKKKLLHDSKFHEDYTNFMENIIDKNYAEIVPTSQVESDELKGKTWYLPHHGVYHSKKPEKIRIVFDCSSKFRGVSLNSVLLHGPDLTNSLLGVLIRFRLEPVAITSDIECMFYQVRVTPEERNFLRFLWWPRGNLKLEPVTYRMCVHLFGATSSPSCSNYALLQTVNDNHQSVSTQARKAVEQNFYVDDFICAVSTEAEAIRLVQEVSTLCHQGGFRLTKWNCNRKSVLETVAKEERAKTVQDLSFEHFPPDRALGVHWNINDDTLGFQIQRPNVRPTRRNVLSVVSSLYDPLGLAAPFVLSAKVLLQELCLQGLEWDEELSGNMLQAWHKWLEDLPNLARLSIHRCLKPEYLGEITNIQLHHFSDASELGYGLASYMCYKNSHGDSHCILLISRSLVTPLKKVTIPRLELTAATVAVKMSHKINQELQMDIQNFYWTDSMAVIRYISSEKARFHTFVANRVSYIRDSTHIKQWKYVPSEKNPADLASRGSNVESILHDDQWRYGPAFLTEPSTNWPEQPSEFSDTLKGDPEVKHSSNIITASTVTEETSPLDAILSYTSSWAKMKRITGWILLAFHTLRKWVKQRISFEEHLNNDLSEDVKTKKVEHYMMQLKRSSARTQTLPNDIIGEAEKILLQHEQYKHYKSEICSLEHAATSATKAPGLPYSSSIYRLDPFLEDCVLRVGGLLSRSQLSFEAKHQILVPHNSHIARAILIDIHKHVGHLGKNAMTTELRRRFWIPKVGILIKNILSKCVICRRYRATKCTQKMSDLPESRMIPDKPPFYHTGMDYFGPYSVKRGRSTIKRYGGIFTCFNSRAVHLEVAHSLTTDSCSQAIRRFLCRHGPISSITSDNGTNLVGAEKELRESIKQWNISKIGRALQQQAITWHFNPPSASHFGGTWERIIRSIRKVMYSLLHEQILHLDDEGLSTLFCEVERIFNSRPITTVSNHPNDLEALCPSDALLCHPGQYLPCGVFDKHDNYPRRRWRQVQYLSGLFWHLWRSEYLHLLHERQKWTKFNRNISVDDIVLVVDQPYGAWTLARVQEVFKDKKGLHVVRIVNVKTAQGVLKRPIHKLSVLLECD